MNRSLGNRPKRILVAGGAGFVGSHLCERLLERGNRVLCVDDFTTGAAENVAHLRTSRRFRLLEHDVVQPLELDVDEVYNLACPASPPHYQADPIRTLKTSVFGAVNLLELARRNDARILQASTSEVYGDPLVHPQTEEYWGNVNPIGPRACYDEGKRAAETLFFDFHRTRGVDVKVARIFNTYGPRMSESDGRIVSNFIVQALHNRPLTVYGDGSQTRSFCYVADMVEGLMALMESPAGIIGPINLGNPDEFRVLEFAELVLRYTGSKSRIEHRPLPVDDPKRRKPDIARAVQWLNWQPATDLETGLSRTIEYFARRQRAARADLIAAE
ncbi:MAG: family NAD-dependent epimerase/dehydratase [Rhodospirillales bacterium]|nr:family NAD-dependent epimerase/dehydratase [Rhodospirillales bacterium]